MTTPAPTWRQELHLPTTALVARAEGIVRNADGIRLAPVAALAPLPGAPRDAHALSGADAAPDGSVFLPDPEGHRVLRIGPCGGPPEPLRCLRGPGAEPGALRAPRGLAVDGGRGVLLVADSGNHRIVLVDLATQQLRGIRGPADPWAEPRPGSAAGELSDPGDVAVDAAGRVYVADSGNGRIQRLARDGTPDPAFEAAVRIAAPAVRRPVRVAIVAVGDDERLVVLDEGGKLVVTDLDGALDSALGAQWRGALAAGGAFGAPPAEARRARAGLLLVGPLVAEPAAPHPERRTRWHRVTLAAAGLGPSTGVALATCTTHGAASPPPPPAAAARRADGPGELAPAGEWRRLPAGALDGLALNEPAPFLWVAIEIAGDGVATPVLEGLRVSSEHEGLLRHLPGEFAADANGREMLVRLLGGLEAELDDARERISGLPRLFDAWAAPDDAQAPWLDWLAGWLAVELDGADASEARRERVARAFARHGRRGTPAALRETIEERFGGPVVLEELGSAARLWQLGASRLGFGTAAAPAEADGAVLGRSATVGGSHLLPEDDHALPLFADVAHCFVVRVPGRLVRAPADRARLEALVEREKPAHTVARVCVVEPRARVGIQAIVGVDAIVAAPAEPLVLGGDEVLGGALRLSGGAAPNRRGLGAGARAGHTTVS
jgi:phage tail-like protein